MKRVTFFLLIIFLISLKCFSQNTITIRVKNNEKLLLEKEISKDTESLVFSNVDINEPITDIEGLSDLRNLVSLEFYNVTINGYDFFANCKNLTSLWISCKISTLKFLETLNSLKKITLEFYGSEEIRTEVVDFSELYNLQKVLVIGFIEKNKTIEKLGVIPRFINVNSNCELVLIDQNIESLSDEDINLLKQYKTVDLYANPVYDNKIEIKKLHNLREY